MNKVSFTLTTIAALAAAPAAFAQATPGSISGGASASTTGGSATTAPTPAPVMSTGGMGAGQIQTTQAPVATTTITQADITPVPPPTTSPRERDTVTLRQTFHPNRPLLFTGGAIFLGSYITTAALTATKVENGAGDRTMYIPAVGPWLHLADSKETGRDLALTVGSGVLQGAGLGLALASLFIPEKVDAATIQAGNVKGHVMPTAMGNNGGGLGAVGTF